jgi:hypothetical protein
MSAEQPPDPATPSGTDGSAGDRWHWTTAIPDAEPDWSVLGRALRTIAPEQLFRWTDAHRLPDGTRVDAFVHRPSTALLFLGADGQPWQYSGMGPGAVGPSLLLTPAPDDQVEYVLGLTTCDGCAHGLPQWARGKGPWTPPPVDGSR